MSEWQQVLGIAYLAVEWVLRILLLAIVPGQRGAAAARSWLVLIFFLPVPGLLLYLLIGRPRFPGWRSARVSAFAPHRDAVLRQIEPWMAYASDAAAGRLAQELGGYPAVEGNKVELLIAYDKCIDRLVSDIDEAQRTVRILIYIFASDATGKRVIAALGRAAARGVACHVLIDPVGSMRWLRQTERLLRSAGVSVREVLPFRLLRRRTRRDMRNHRKLFLIDGKIGYVGSQNLIDKEFRSGISNCEVVARVEGPAVVEMETVFLGDWYLETEQLLASSPAPLCPNPPCPNPPCPAPPYPDSANILQMLPSGADDPPHELHTFLVWRVHAASRKITITTPYLVPTDALLDALATAVRRGVEVDIIVSAVIDHWLVGFAQRAYYDDLLTAGIRLYERPDHFLHAKMIAIDGELAIVGSSNLDVRSFDLNEEISMLVHQGPAIEEIDHIQAAFRRQSRAIARSEWMRRPRWQRFLENIARLFSPLL